MKTFRLCISSFLLLKVIVVEVCYGHTILVPQNHTTIQAAIDEASNGDTVLVDEGTYVENIFFNGKSIVVASRFVIDHNPDHILNTIIDGSSGIQGVNGSCVHFINNEDSTAVIQGFKLANGTGSKAENYIEGGGVLLIGSSATVRNNLIVNGHVPNGGGGISSFRPNSEAHIYNNIIVNNSGSLYAGGIVLNWTGGIIRNNIIMNNTGGPNWGGGGILIWDIGTKTAIVENNTIICNKSEDDGGGIITHRSGTPIIRNNIIWGNVQNNGNQATFNSNAILEYNSSDIQLQGTGNISGDPDLEDITFSLKTGSACINAGDPDDKFNDKDGSRNDLGAFGGPFVDVFPEYTVESISLSSQLVYYMNIGESLSQNLIIRNSGTQSFVIDSITVSKELAGYLQKTDLMSIPLNPMMSDTIKLTLAPTEKVYIIDSILLYHQGTEISNPLKVQISLVTDHEKAVDRVSALPRRAQWNFEEASGATVIDETGISNGEITGGNISRVDGVRGTCLGFSGSQGNVTIPHTDRVEFDSTQSFAISMLAKCDPISYISENFLIKKGTSDGIGKWLAIAFKNRELRFSVDDNVVKTGISCDLPKDYKTNEWHHIVAVRDQEARKLFLYLDGDLISEIIDNTKGSIESGLPLELDNNNRSSNAAIDEVQIFATSLTGIDVKALFSSYSLPEPSSDVSVTNLEVEGHSFNEGSFNPAITTYTVTLPDSIKYVNILVNTSDFFAGIKGDGRFSRMPEPANITITSDDGTAEEMYTINFDITTSTQDLNSAEALRVFPNPASTVINISVSNELVGNPIQLINTVGEILYSNTIKNNQIIVDVSGYKSGLYFLKINNTVKQILINRN